MRREEDIQYKRDLDYLFGDEMDAPRAGLNKTGDRISCQNSSPSEIRAASRLIIVHRAKLII